MFNSVAPKYDLFGNSTPVVNFDPNVIQTSYSQPSNSSGMIGGILQGVSSLFNSFASIGAGKRQARRQKEVAEHNYNLQMQAYERQLADQERLIAEEREYNDFTSVAKRARDAGFNPNAVVGTASGGNVSTSTPSLDAPQIEASPIDPLMQVGSSIQGAINAYQQAEMVREQIKAQKLANADAEAELKDKDRKKAHEIAMDEYAEIQAKLNNSGTELDNAIKSLTQQSASEDLDIKRQTKVSVIKLAEVNLQLANDAHKENEQQFRKNEIDLKTYEERCATELEHMKASIWAIYHNADLSERQFEFTKEQAAKTFDLALRHYHLDRKSYFAQRIDSWVQKFRDFLNDSHVRKMDKARFNRETDRLLSELPDSLPGIAMFFVSNMATMLGNWSNGNFGFSNDIVDHKHNYLGEDYVK